MARLRRHREAKRILLGVGGRDRAGAACILVHGQAGAHGHGRVVVQVHAYRAVDQSVITRIGRHDVGQAVAIHVEREYRIGEIAGGIVERGIEAAVALVGQQAELYFRYS